MPSALTTALSRQVFRRDRARVSRSARSKHCTLVQCGLGPSISRLQICCSSTSVITPARTYERLIASYPNPVIIGLTATPCRTDGRGLGNLFETLIECPSVAALTKD